MCDVNIYAEEKKPCISNLGFSWYSNTETKNNSVLQIRSSEEINDLRLGASIEDTCLTCNHKWSTCPGHFGSYEFFKPLFHPLRTTEAKKALPKSKTEKYFVKQNILNIKKEGKPWRAMTVYDMNIQDYTPEGIDKEHPYLVKVMPISPPCLRPTCVTISSKVSVSQNDITHRLGSLLRIDQNLRKSYALNPNNIEEHNRILSRLQLAFTLLFFPPPGNREARELSCLSDRLKGKDGRMRLSLLGKRVEYSSRTVISGDNYLALDEVGVPNAICMKLTLPEYVTNFNKEYLTGLLHKKMVKTIQRQKRSIDPKYGMHDLRIGDVVHRYLMDGDYVLINRQPSLWASSIQALKVKRFPEDSRLDPHSIRLNVEVTPGFNADFDGDEMNLYAPQSIEARAEMKHLMSVENHLIIAGNGMVQDSSLGIYILSVDDKDLGKSLFFDCILWIREPFYKGQNYYDPPYTSRRLLSFLFPEYVHLEGYVEHGVVVGPLTKKITRNKLLPMIHNEDPSLSLKFLFSIQRIASEYFRRRGFSVGLEHLLPDKNIDLVFNSKIEGMNDWEMACTVRRLKNEKAIEAKNMFSKTNNFIQLTSEGSGAKGSLMNIIQMKATLGQQYVNGDVIHTYRNSDRGNRVLSSDSFGKSNIFTHGFIKGGFLKGLNPKEMFLHSISSRINLLDTSLKTANSGYASRKIWKCLEDTIVQHPTWKDGPMTVRCSGKILRFDIGRHALNNRILEPGLPLGIILSQTVGQNVMQLTLNTFHNVGSGNKTVEGVPRLESLINKWEKKQKQQAMLMVKMTPFQVHRTIMQRDKLQLKELVKKTFVKNKKIVFHLDVIKCIRKRIHPFQVEEKINQCHLAPVFCGKISKEFVLEVVTSSKIKRNLLEKAKMTILKMKLRGDNVSIFDGDGEAQIVGRTLQQEFESMNEHSLKLLCNNVLEVQKTLGIEAAYTVLVQEFTKVFNGAVQELYFKILSEWMCFLGTVTPTTRMGLSSFYGDEDGVWKGMSFERTLKTASTAASKNLSSSFNGLSEKVIINDLPMHGTGFLDIIKDKNYKEKEITNNFFRPYLKRKRFEEVDEEEPWLMDTTEPREDGFVGGDTFNPNQMYNTSMTGMMPSMYSAPAPLSPTYDPFLPDGPPSPSYNPLRPSSN